MTTKLTMPTTTVNNEQLLPFAMQQRNFNHAEQADYHSSQDESDKSVENLTSSSSDDDLTSGDLSTLNHQKWFKESIAIPVKSVTESADDNSPYDAYPLTSTDSHKNSPVAYQPGHGKSSKTSDDDYRSVIDDLTIENKILKEKLRQYTKKSSSLLEKDKLFEVRIHSLPLEKRRELEATLQRFASSLHSPSNDPSSADNGSQSFSAHGYAPFAPNSSSISHKLSLVASSANLSTLPSEQSSSFPAEKTGRRGILPSYPEPPADTEIIGKRKISQPKIHTKALINKQKKKLVVKRLERLFTGKAAASAEYDGYYLNQIDTQMLTGVNEGSQNKPRAPTREAHMENATDDDLSRMMYRTKTTKPKTPVPSDSSDQIVSESSSINQRPTYALDLDPNRAQIPSENVEYIRHLGFESVVLSDFESNTIEKSNGCWIYLNLLINMAQLHIINVTPDFVRSAISEVSEKFEVSPDGQMLRWKGGSDGTNLSSDTGASSDHESDPVESLDQNKPTSRLRRFMPLEKHQLRAPNEPQLTSGKFHYQPLFYHHPPSESNSESNDSILESDGDIVDKISNKIIHPQQSWQPAIGKHKSNGSIVFYNGADFCTDLSGESVSILSPIDKEMSEESSADDARTSTNHPPIFRTNSGSYLDHRPFKLTPEDTTTIDSVHGVADKLDPSCDCLNDVEFICSEPQDESVPITAPLLLNETWSTAVVLTDYFVIQVTTQRSISAVCPTGNLSNLLSFDNRSFRNIVLARISPSHQHLSTSPPRRFSPETLPVKTYITSLRYKFSP